MQIVVTAVVAEIVTPKCAQYVESKIPYASIYDITSIPG